MSNERMDEIAKQAAAGMDRRGMVKTLGAAALGAAGLVAVRGAASAGADAQDKLSTCKDRCRDHTCPGKKHPNQCLRKCKDRCKRKHG